MKIHHCDIGVCTWSLQMGITDLSSAVKQMGLDHIHLALGPALADKGQDYLTALSQQSWTISSTMIDFVQEDYSSLESIRNTGGVVPDDCWLANKRRFEQAVDITDRLKVNYISMHAGFIDHTVRDYAQKMSDRIGCLADIAGEKDLNLLLETGQESAPDMIEFLERLDHQAIGVNFDPANMILYDKGDPLEAMRLLQPWIKHMHIKDAILTEQPGTWGVEVPWGQGQVDEIDFLNTIDEIGYRGILAIEREAGDNRLADIQQAVDRLRLLVKES